MTAVRFEHVSKRFVLHHERARTFQEAALNLARVRRQKSATEEFWALRDVSFALEAGRTLGVIGRNGSGKSTLLKLLAGTMRPTSGSISANGRVFGLLELAAGFHPELSGRENVFLNGAFLGLSRAEMEARLDGIVAFAELEQFIDTPVKHYSSGMYMRLGFAIAVSVEPDILVIDEVLAVGDAAFRQKCFASLAEMKASGKTILFVTHDAAAVRRFCDEALWLDHGLVRATGTADAVLQEYLAETTVTHGEALVFAGKPRDPLAETRGPVELLGVEPVDEYGRLERHFEPGQIAGVQLRYRATTPAASVAFGVGLHRADGTYVWGSASPASDVDSGDGALTCRLGALPLAAAEYTLSGAVWVGGEAIQRLSQTASFAVRPPHTDQAGMLVLDACWQHALQVPPSEHPLAPPPRLPPRPWSSAPAAPPISSHLRRPFVFAGAPRRFDSRWGKAKTSSSVTAGTARKNGRPWCVGSAPRPASS
jgi:lipopolysaccharide transport system ATP-binding protein